MNRASRGVCVLFGMMLLTGDAVRAQDSYKEITVKNGGTVMGTVSLAGTVPPPLRMMITKDEKICGRNKTSPRLILGKNSGVQYAVVCLEDVKEGKAWKSSEAVLGQRACQYEPHVMLSQVGTPLVIYNDDPILHNIHTYFGDENGKTICNIAQPVKGQRSTVNAKHFSTPGRVVATCDAGHPWMSAYIIVTGHPYYAVTDRNGKYELHDIPPGTYTVKMWHEGVTPVDTLLENGKPKAFRFEEHYESQREITVPANAKITANFDLVLRASPGE